MRKIQWNSLERNLSLDAAKSMETTLIDNKTTKRTFNENKQKLFSVFFCFVRFVLPDEKQADSNRS